MARKSRPAGYMAMVPGRHTSHKEMVLDKTHATFRRVWQSRYPVDPRWSTLAGFLVDMGERPAGMSLERTDLAGPFNRSNCFWGDGKDRPRRIPRHGCNTSGYRGVSYHEARRKFGASISLAGDSLHIGLYETATEAAAAYNTASVTLFGNSAVTRCNQVLPMFRAIDGALVRWRKLGVIK